MTFVTPTDDIILQEGTFAFSFEASGAISGGMLVKPAGPMFVVKASAETDNVVGVAAYSVAKNDMVSVYGPGNIVRTYAGVATAVAADVYPSANAGIDDSATYGSTSVPCGVSLEAISAAGTIRVLLK